MITKKIMLTIMMMITILMYQKFKEARSWLPYPLGSKNDFLCFFSFYLLVIISYVIAIPFCERFA